jgi:hypothetical protein
MYRQRSVKLAILVAVFGMLLMVAAFACKPPWIYWIVTDGGSGTDGAVLTGTVTLKSDVGSEKAITGVDIYIDDQLWETISIPDSTIAITSATIKYKLDTTRLANGAHTIYEVAHAKHRPDGTSEVLTVYVDNPPPPPPTDTAPATN